MSPSFKTKYKTDTVPPLIYPFYIVIGYVLGYLLTFYFLLIHFTCRIKIRGDLPAENTDSSYIHCLWHASVMLYFCVFTHVKKHVWINHPYWYMKPIHVSIRLHGVEALFLGSSGNSGREAAAHVINHLKRGYRTMINPDGPEGPAKVLKRGVLHMSMNAMSPIIPLYFRGSAGFRFKGWDQKFLPFPFSSIEVVVGSPIVVSPESFAEDERQLIRALG